VLTKILTPNLRMRPFRTDDAEALHAVMAEEEVGRWVGGAHTTLDQTRELIARNRRHQARHGFSMWAVEERVGGELVGEVGLQHLEQTGDDVEIGWSLAPHVWGLGYATEAARAWLDAAFGQLDLDEVIAVVRPDNDASHRVAQRLGMQRAGRRRAYDRELDLYVIRRVSVTPGAGA
jgi:RimJ/RimL family protein N-acetyltransferase